MQRRLTLVLVLLIAGTLLMAGAGTLVVARTAARSDAARQLLAQATTFADAPLKTPRVLGVVNAVLRLEGGRIITVTPAGAILTPLPVGVRPAELDPARLMSGLDVSGSAGGTVFAAVPVQLAPRIAGGFLPGGHVAVLLTRQVGTLGPSWLYFLLVSGITLAVAAAVAAWLTRRITRPLVEASSVTGRIAGGEQTARVVTRPGDYPELVSMGESINAMAERLEGGRDRERQLLLSVSHDLRTPLTSIRGYAEAIQEGVASDVVSAAGVIVSESRRLERLVADLLDLARLGADRLSLHIGPTDVGQVVGTTVEGFRPRATAAGVRLTAGQPTAGQPTAGQPTAGQPTSGQPTSGDGPLRAGVFVAADPDRLAQIVANLVENSLAFARGSVRVRVAGSPSAPPASLPSAPGKVFILVEDDGPGIAAGELDRVFDRFFQSDRGVAARRGLGLGLAIVAELVRAMGGQVRAESPIRDGGGTRMVVELQPWSRPGPVPPAAPPPTAG